MHLKLRSTQSTTADRTSIARRSAALLVSLPLVFAACGGTDATDDTASDEIATLSTEALATDDDERAAEPTTTAATDTDTSDDTGSSDDAEESSDPQTSEDDSAEADDATTDQEPADVATDDEEPLSEDDAQDILNDFSACMRTEGFDDFPDIVVGGNGARQIIDAGIDPLDDQFGDAFEACGDGLEQLQTSQDELSPEQQLTAEAALLAGAVCMRESGYEDFPDPDFTQGYGQQAYIPGLLASGIDIMSSEFQAAGQECSRRISDEYNLGDN